MSRKRRPMNHPTRIRGHFWLAEPDSPRMEGTLEFVMGSAASLSTQGALTSMLSAAEEKTAPDGSSYLESHFAPDRSLRTVHGETEEGVSLTLLETQNQGYSGGFRPHEQDE